MVAVGKTELCQSNNNKSLHNTSPFGLPSDQKALPSEALGVSLSPTPSARSRCVSFWQAHPFHRNMPELPPTLLCRGPDLPPGPSVSQWLRASPSRLTRSSSQFVRAPATNNGSGVGEQKTVACLTSSATLLAPETDVPCTWETADVAPNGR